MGKFWKNPASASHFLVKSCSIAGCRTKDRDAYWIDMPVWPVFFEVLSADGSRVVACPDKIQSARRNGGVGPAFGTAEVELT